MSSRPHELFYIYLPNAKWAKVHVTYFLESTRQVGKVADHECALRGDFSECWRKHIVTKIKVALLFSLQILAHERVTFLTHLAWMPKGLYRHE